MAEVFLDNFTDSFNTPLTSHTPDVGVGWDQVYSSGGNLVIRNGTLAFTGSSSDGAIGEAILSGGIPVADYDVTVRVSTTTSYDDTMHLIARDQNGDGENLYGLSFANGYLFLFKLVNNFGTTLATGSPSIPNNTNVTLRVQGNVISVLLNGSEIESVEDDSHSGAGSAGCGYGDIFNNGEDYSAQAFTWFRIDTLISFGLSGEVTLNGSPVEGATVRCIRQSDNVALAELTTDSVGQYLFEDLDESELYHVAVEYEADSVKYNAPSLWDVSPYEL